MKRFIAVGAVLAATFSGAVADLCADGSTDDDGNYYCQAVTAITYTGMEASGSYNKVTDMDSTTGDCSSSAYAYSGSMSPLDEEVSIHFRGPIQIKQFAVYTPSSSSSKKAKRSAMHRHGHAHEHLHKHKRDAAAKRSVGDEVIATIDGQVVSWVNEYTGEATSSASAAEATSVSLTLSAQVKAATVAAASSAESSAAASSSASATAAASSSSSSSSSGSWSRSAYYNAAAGTADGVTFLNHNGGTGSGVFDYEFGNSLSYSSEDGTTGVSSPAVLSDVTLGSDVEVLIMSDNECSDDECGYVRDGTVAYHGFDGAQKAFFFEFQMPLDGNTDADTNGDMPAIWLLNAQIPRTLQYGKAACSCWTTGCGEFDIFEVLAPGDLRCKSTLHGNVAGGDSDYVVRPTGSTIKAAVILNGSNIHIKVLDDDFDISSSLDASTISDICSETLVQSLVTSLFALAS